MLLNGLLEMINNILRIRIPLEFVGWIKLIFFEFGRDARARGFCR